jgi:hypothetical protein
MTGAGSAARSPNGSTNSPPRPSSMARRASHTARRCAWLTPAPWSPPARHPMSPAAGGHARSCQRSARHLARTTRPTPGRLGLTQAHRHIHQTRYQPAHAA